MVTRITGGEAVVKSLQSHGIKTIYGLPGVQNDALYNALYDAGAAMRVVHTRHEQGAAYMALGAALSTGKPAVYSVVPGPGLLNTTAALSTAYATNAPVFCLTGQIPSASIGRGYGLLHEIPDQLGILRSLTKWATRINAPAEAPELIDEAFYQLAAGRPRPVGIEIPPDVLAASSVINLTQARREIDFPPVDTDAVERAAQLLGAARRPMIFVGSGALDAGDDVRRLAEALQAPVVSTRSGHGILSSRHELSIRTPEAYQLWSNADVVLAIGTRIQGPLQNWGYDKNLKIIRIDIDASEHSRIVPPAVGLVARSQDVLPVLIDAIERHNPRRPSRAQELAELRREVAASYAYLEPQLAFIKAIRAELPDDGFFVEEMTQVSYVSRFTLPIYHPRTFVTTGYQGTLGWGFAAALGVKAANPDRAVVSVTGDGGFMFNVQELATAVQHKIASVTVVFNDGAYGNVQRAQRDDYGNRVIATELRNPDFSKLADSFGALGLRAHTPEELRRALQRGFAADVPTIIDVPVGEMPSPWPIVMRTRNR